MGAECLWGIRSGVAISLAQRCNRCVPGAGRCVMAVRGVQDEQLRPLLEMYRQAGRKVFIATNSLWDYTNVVMNFLIDGKVGAERDTEWLQVRSHPAAALWPCQVACQAHHKRAPSCVIVRMWQRHCAVREGACSR